MKVISCGQFLVSIEGKQELLDSFQPRWELKKITYEHPDAVIHLEEGSNSYMGIISKPWQVFHDDGIDEVVYFQKDKPLFSLIHSISTKEIKVKVWNCFGNTVRIAIHYGLMLALYEKSIGLHGVTLLCGDEVIILSAPSGTGKTTLSKLLERYSDAIVINGDFALLSPTENGVIFEPTPFCGTSGRALNHRFRVDRIVFLRQAKDNKWHDLDGREAMMQFLNNCFVPTWNKNVREVVQRNILKCIDALEINAYAFAPTQEAAETFLRRVESRSS